MCKNEPENTDDDKYTIRNHIIDENMEYDTDLDTQSLLYKGKHGNNKPYLLACITMYNEPPSQLIESLAGIYRTYYELEKSDQRFKGKVQVVIVIDGYDRISEEDLAKYK